MHGKLQPDDHRQGSHANVLGDSCHHARQSSFRKYGQGTHVITLGQRASDHGQGPHVITLGDSASLFRLTSPRLTPCHTTTDSSQRDFNPLRLMLHGLMLCPDYRPVSTRYIAAARFPLVVATLGIVPLNGAGITYATLLA
eukprot:1161677-Pelagomonas_calceolata.AAC.6